MRRLTNPRSPTRNGDSPEGWKTSHRQQASLEKVPTGIFRMNRMNSSGIHPYPQGTLTRPLRGARGEAVRVPGGVEPGTLKGVQRLHPSRNRGQGAEYRPTLSSSSLAPLTEILWNPNLGPRSRRIFFYPEHPVYPCFTFSFHLLFRMPCHRKGIDLIASGPRCGLCENFLFGIGPITEATFR